MNNRQGWGEHGDNDREVEERRCGVHRCAKATEKALLVENLDDPTKRFWVPRSVVRPDSEVKGEEDIGELVLAEWFCEKEGIV